jgi:Tfp pilus assembly protein PilN
MSESNGGAILEAEKKVQFLQYVNTAILTFIATIAMIIFISIRDMKTHQESTLMQLTKFQVLQDHNTQQLDDVDARVKVLEISNQVEFKNWVDNNFVRKILK